MGQGSLRKLFEPIQINGMKLRNRIVMPAMDTGYAADDHSVTQRLIDYHAARARGGVALNILEFTAVHPGGRAMFNQVGVWDDRFIPGLKALAGGVHEHGGKICLQLHHAGRETTPEVCGAQPVAPSPIPSPRRKVVPRETTPADIDELVEAYGQAARRARQAGFDAVEVHGAHGYLLGQFISPYTNKRTDAYGGDVHGRLRFPLEVVRRVREEVGPNYPILFRISGEEHVPGGLTLDETKRIARLLEQAGVDCIHVSVGVIESYWMIMAPTAVAPGYNVHTSQGVKEVVKIPVITVGRINDPELAERILSEGMADLVSFGRALLADPDLPVKAQRGEFSDIRRCIACLHGCDNEPITCTQNPELGKERELELRPAAARKTVLVAGGGPAGLEAAHVAAARGHRVILFEAKSALGGQMALAALPPTKAEVRNVVDWRVGQLKKHGVEVRIGQQLTVAIVEELRPDVVIVATGARPSRPPISGVREANVVTAIDVLSGEAVITGPVAVIGGGMVGCETADYLGAQGKKVTIIEQLDQAASDVGGGARRFLMERLSAQGTEIITDARAVEITADGLVIEQGGERRTLPAVCTVVLAVGMQSEAELARELEGKVKEIYVVGDASRPRRALEAVTEGAMIARQI